MADKDAAPTAPKKVVLVDIRREGEKLILPSKMTYMEGINALHQQMQAEENEVQVSELIDGFIWDGAYALYKAMEQKFGFANQVPIPGFFGPQPPQMVTIETGFETSVQIPWGRFTLPGLDGWVQTGTGRKGPYLVLAVIAMVKKKHEGVIKELCALAREYLKKESIYKGNAFKIYFTDPKSGAVLPIPQASFMDLSKVQVPIFSREVAAAVETSLLTPIEKREECRRLGVPAKRGILLSGPFGTGKTLVSYMSAWLGVKNGWTFIYCNTAADLSQCVEFARQYQPAIIFCEDVDREAAGGRTEDMDKLLNIIDGIDSKGQELMVVLTTNDVSSINKAMLRPGRLDAVIHVAPPDAEAVVKLIHLYGGGLVPSNEDLTEVAKQLEGTIPAVIRECVERAKLAALRDCQKGELPKVLKSEHLLQASMSMKNQLDLLNAPEKTKPLHLESALAELVKKSQVPLRYNDETEQYEPVATNGNGQH